MKSTVDEIRRRFDNDVERFSNENTGQATAVDAQLVMKMIADTIALFHEKPQAICDIGCGAGNFSLRIGKTFPRLRYTLIDLSRPMLRKAQERLEAAGGIVEQSMQNDIRLINLPENKFDIIVAAAVLHHLREKKEWVAVLKNIYNSLSQNGTFWLWDFIKHDDERVGLIQWARYKDYLISIKDEKYQKHVFRYIEKEDTPESIPFILRTLEEVGFKKTDILHKNILFAAIMAQK